MKDTKTKPGGAERRPDNPHKPSRPLGQDLLLMAGLSGLSLVLLWLIFPPRCAWPLAFVGLVPWALAVCRIQRPWVAHWGSFLFGWLFFLWNLSWLWPVTGLGYLALAFYLALYWTLTAWALRTGRRAGISPVWTLPVIWVGCEFLRGWVMTGLPWLYLSHAFYKQLIFIQISDLVGAYGVTFIVALVNGALIEWGLYLWRCPTERRRRKPALIGSLAAVVLLIGNYAYGWYRLNESEFTDGPRVAVIQEDFLLSSTPPYSEHQFVVFARYLALAAEAAREKPDLLVFPETVWASTQNIDFVREELQAPEEVSADTWQYGKLCDNATAAFARGDYAGVNQVIARFERSLNSHNSREQSKYQLPRLPAEGGPPVTLVCGSVSLDTSPEQAYPRQERFNSALIYDPDGQQRSERYDKIHLVPFGEFVPFRNARVLGIDLHWLYRLLNRLSPFSYGGTIEYSLTAGRQLTVFNLEVGDETYRFGTPICYEDTVPYLPRRYVQQSGQRRVDFLVNISNDGWFLHSDELPQHLAICTFRAIENRIGIARAVNTGISGFIDPTGRIYSLVEEDERTYGPGLIGYRVGTIEIDQRSTLYGRTGDWFAMLCVLCTTALWGGAIVTRWVFALQKRLVARRARKRGKEHAAS